MEGQSGVLSPTEAREALALVARADADLADRLVTPWWYHPGLGLAEAALVTSCALPTLWRVLVVIGASAGVGLLASAWARSTGLGAWSCRYSTLAWRWVAALTGVVLVAHAAALLTDRVAVTLTAAGSVLVATVVLGRRGDDALRRRPRAGARG